MKKTRATHRKSRGRIASEYRFDYGKSRSNRFAERIAQQALKHDRPKRRN